MALVDLESQFGLCEPPLELLLECRLLGKGARQSAVLVFSGLMGISSETLFYRRVLGISFALSIIFHE